MIIILIAIWAAGVYGVFVFIYCRNSFLAKRYEPKLMGLLACVLVLALLGDLTNLLDPILDNEIFLILFLAIWTGTFSALAATYQKRFLNDRRVSFLVLGGFFSIASIFMMISLLAGTFI